jgi:hypothetical protein
MVLEATAPVGGLTNVPLAQQDKKILNVFLADRQTHANFVCHFDRYANRQVVMDSLQHEVLGLFPVELPRLGPLDDRGSVMWVDNSITGFKTH